MKTVNYGILIGLGLAILVALLDWLLPPGRISFALAETLGYSSMVLGTAMVFFVLRARRREAARWGFGVALREALATVAVIAVAFAAGIFIYFQFLQPESLLRIYEHYEQTLLAAGGGDQAAAQLEDMRRNRELYLDPKFQAGVMGVTVLAVGLVVGAICAYLVRQDRN